MKELPELDHVLTGVKHIPAQSKKYGYTWVVRSKRHHPWLAAAHVFCSGSTCLAVAIDYFKLHGYEETDHSKGKLVDDVTFLKLEVTQHLKSLGIK